MLFATFVVKCLFRFWLRLCRARFFVVNKTNGILSHCLRLRQLLCLCLDEYVRKEISKNLPSKNLKKKEGKSNMEATTTEKRKALRKMMQGPGCHIAPSCNDGIQARLVEWLGFPLVHISIAATPRSLGFADAGLLTLTEMMIRAREIVEAVQIPIVSDAETGYGNVVNVVRAVSRIRARRRRRDSHRRSDDSQTGGA